ncbi:MAG: hypothetical protein U0P30_02565 [Vicinamibacterales bacterium]
MIVRPGCTRTSNTGDVESGRANLDAVAAVFEPQLPEHAVEVVDGARE